MDTRDRTKWLGIGLAFATGGSAIALSVIAYPFVAPALRKICLPYVPATTVQVNNVISALSLLKPRRFVDLGSGDGRLVIAAAKYCNNILSGETRTCMSRNIQLASFNVKEIMNEDVQSFINDSSEINKEITLCTGVELNPWLVLYSRYSAWRSGVSHLTNFKTTDLWNFSLRSFDTVVCFGVEQMMVALEDKLSYELPSYGSVIVCRYPLPNWTPAMTFGAGIDTVWLYRKPLSSATF